MHNCICYYCYYVIWGVKDAPKLFSFVIVCVHDRFMFLYVYSDSCNKSIKYYIEYYKYNKFLAKSHGVNAGPLCKGSISDFWSWRKCGQSKYWDVTTCFYAFLDIPKSLEILREIFTILVCLQLYSYTGAHWLCRDHLCFFLPNCSYLCLAISYS